MKVYVTIGYAKDGKAKVIAGPEVPYQKQKELLANADAKSFVRAELWSRSSGKIKQRRIKAKPTTTKKAKTEKENENEE